MSQRSFAKSDTLCAHHWCGENILPQISSVPAAAHAMKPSFEKLVPSSGESFRCFDRKTLRSPVKWHRHPEVELTFVERGSGARLVGDHIGSYGDCDLVLLGSDLPHTWSSDEYRGQTYDRHSAMVVQFHPEFLGADFFRSPDLKPVAALIQKAKRGISYPPQVAVAIGERITAMLHMKGARRLAELLTCLHELTLARNTVCLSSASYIFTATQAGETRIQQICDHIAQHLSEPKLNHKTLADLVYMNPSAFSRFFRQSTGRTVTAHISELRIGLACRLLTETDDTILNISLEAGFANLSNFNRRFRELRNTTPREYRKRYQIIGHSD